MLCKHCGKKMPAGGNFCPYCGAFSADGGVNDETTFFTPAPSSGHIDLSAFDAALNDTHHPTSPDMEDGVTTGDPLSLSDADFSMTPEPKPEPQLEPRREPPGRTQRSHTTYFDPEPIYNEPYRRPSAAMKVGRAFVIILFISALIGGGVWFALSRKPDESLTVAEKYMMHGKFDEALAAYQDALPEAKDPSAIQLQIDQLKSYQQARSFMEEGDYSAALATLSDLRGRITDSTSALAEEVGRMREESQEAIAEGEFAEALQAAQTCLEDGKYDAAAGKLDSLASDSQLSSEQAAQVDKLREQLNTAQAAAQRQEADRKEKIEKKEAFRKDIETLEESDKKILSAKSVSEELELTTKSFNSWDSLLVRMYDYLSTILNADQYAAEEEKYQQWLEERNSGAANAAKESTEDPESDKPENENSDDGKTEGGSETEKKENEDAAKSDDTEKPDEADKEGNTENTEKTDSSSDEKDAEKKNKKKSEASELASVSFKQSYTKTRCYRLLDMID